MKWLCLLVAGGTLAACETPSTAVLTATTFDPPQPGKGALYIVSGYIPDTPSILVGASTVGSLAKHSWLRVELAPGTYALQARSPYSESSLSLTIAAATSTFVQLQFVDSRPWQDVLSKVSDSQGHALVAVATPAAQQR
jgi:hypothetical protein